MVALTSTIWRKNSDCRKNNPVFAAKGRLIRPFSFSLPSTFPCGTIPAFFILKGQKMDKRFVQAHKEARWALWLTLLYLAAWLAAAYLPGVSIGFTGLPHWFEMACLLVPLLFILLCWAMVRFIFRDILWRITMQLEIIVVLIAYLFVVFGLSIYAMRKRSTGNFLSEYFLGSRSMGGLY
jgi:uncharacterized membrane protein YhdT